MRTILAVVTSFAVSHCGSPNASETKDLALLNPDADSRIAVYLDLGGDVIAKQCPSGDVNRMCGGSEITKLPYPEFIENMRFYYKVAGYDLTWKGLDQLDQHVQLVKGEIGSGTLNEAELVEAEARFKDLNARGERMNRALQLIDHLQAEKSMTVFSYKSDFKLLMKSASVRKMDLNGVQYQYIGELPWNDAEAGCDGLGLGWRLPNHKRGDLTNSEDVISVLKALEKSMPIFKIGDSGDGYAFWSGHDTQADNAVYWYKLARENSIQRDLTPRTGAVTVICMR